MLLVVCSTLLGLLLGGFLLRRDAQKARRAVVVRLRDQIFDGLTDEDQESFIRQAEGAIQDIEGENRGAFRPLSEDPVLAAVFIPFGGTGTLILAERMLHYL